MEYHLKTDIKIRKLTFTGHIFYANDEEQMTKMSYWKIYFLNNHIFIKNIQIIENNE